MARKVREREGETKIVYSERDGARQSKDSSDQQRERKM